MKVTVKWAKTEEEFKETSLEGEWVVSEKNELINMTHIKLGVLPKLPKRTKVKESICVIDKYPANRAEWMRSFCNEHHPEINFDEEFGPGPWGVVAKYYEKFEFDYMEAFRDMQYEILKEQLAAKHYILPWDKHLKLVK